MKEETYPLRNRSVLYRSPISICRGHRGMKEQCQYSEKGSIIRILKKKTGSFKLNPASYNNVTELLLNPFEETIVLTHLTFNAVHWQLCSNGSNPSSLPRRERSREGGRQALVVYNLQKGFRKIRLESNGKRHFGSSQWKIFVSNGTSKMVVLFFRTESSKWKFVFHSLKPSFIPVSGLRVRYSVNALIKW